MNASIKDNTDKVKQNKVRPWLVANIVEILDLQTEEDKEEDGASMSVDAQREGQTAVVKTSTRQTIFLPMVGLVPTNELSPGDLVGVNKDSYLVLDKLPTEYDSRVKVREPNSHWNFTRFKAFEVDERPTEQYTDIGGLDKQIQELVEAIVLPMVRIINRNRLQEAQPFLDRKR